MKETISDLWRGEIHPMEQRTENDDEESELYDVIDGYYDKLWNKLDDDGKQILCSLKELYTRLSSLENEDSFTQGFSLATKLMTEALSE